MRSDDPSSLTPDERRSELASIFAAGILRLHARVATHVGDPAGSNPSKFGGRMP